MTARVLLLDAAAHRSVQALLPWYAAGALDAAERARVEAHLAVCARCRRELAFDRRLQAAQPELPPDEAWERSLVRVQRRLAAAPATAAPKVPRRRQRPPERGWRRLLGPSWGWLVAAPATALLALGPMLLDAPGPPVAPYRALGAQPVAPGARLIVRFRPQATELEMRRALRLSGARLLDGPTGTDAYLLSIAPGEELRALERLRADGAVEMAASLAPARGRVP